MCSAPGLPGSAPSVAEPAVPTPVLKGQDAIPPWSPPGCVRQVGGQRSGTGGCGCRKWGWDGGEVCGVKVGTWVRIAWVQVEGDVLPCSLVPPTRHCVREPGALGLLCPRPACPWGGSRGCLSTLLTQPAQRGHALAVLLGGELMSRPPTEDKQLDPFIPTLRLGPACPPCWAPELSSCPEEREAPERRGWGRVLSGAEQTSASSPPLSHVAQSVP